MKKQHRFGTFYRDTRGSILLIFALSVVILIVTAGVGIDLGSNELVRAKLQYASDTATTSAAGLQTPTIIPTNTQRRVAAERYFKLNFPANFNGTNRPAPVISVTDDAIEVTATASSPTYFISNLSSSWAQIQTKGNSKVAINRSASSSDMDVVVVIDESGSTSYQGRMQSQRNAVGKFILSLLPPGAPPTPNVRVGLVGYSAWISNKWGLTSNGLQAFTDLVRFAPRLQNFDHWGMTGGINMAYGGLPSGHNQTISEMKVCVETFLGICTKYRRWAMNFEMPPPRTSRSDGKFSSPNKVIIFVTDGRIMLEPGAGVMKGQGDPNPGPAPNYGLFVNECNRAKSMGITVYTTVFAEPPNAAEIAALKNCASINPVNGQPRYMYSPDEEALTTFLLNTSATLRKVRIIK